MAAIKILTLIRLGCHILNGSGSPLFFLKRIGNGFFFRTIVFFELALNARLLMYPSSSNSSLFCDAYQRGLGLTKGRQSHSQPSGSCETGPSLPPPLPGYYGYPAMGGEGWYSWASPPPGRPASQWGPGYSTGLNVTSTGTNQATFYIVRQILIDKATDCKGLV